VKSPIQKIIKEVIGLVLLPLVVISIAAFFVTLKDISWFRYDNYYFLLGTALYALVFSVTKERSFAYVLGHEVMHALAAMLFGGKLVSIFISEKSGCVRTTKDNFFISLAPYLVPFYATCLTLLYCFISIFARIDRYLAVFIFLLGYSLTHHLFFTIHYLKQGQTDLKKHGIIFGLVLIILLNIAIYVLFIDIFLKAVPTDTFVRTIEIGLKKIYLYKH